MMLVTTLEIVLCHWKEGKLEAIERKNGGLERYKTRPATWADSVELFDANQNTQELEKKH